MDILKIAKIILSGGTVEEVIQEFENGEFPILDNVQQQMALLIFTEELAGHLFVEEQFLSEALQTWKMLREDVYQIYSFVKKLIYFSFKCTHMYSGQTNYNTVLNYSESMDFRLFPYSKLISHTCTKI